MIPYGRQDITEADIESVVSVLRSDYLTQGPMVPRFEESVSRHVGAQHAIAVNSATSALHIACLVGFYCSYHSQTHAFLFCAYYLCNL